MNSSSSFAVWIPLLFAAVILAFGATSTWKAVNSARVARQAVTWPTTPARIESAEIRERAGRRGARSYRVEVRYTYNVAGTDYQGNIISPMYVSSGSRAAAEDLAAHLQPGKSVQVSADPLQPQNSMIVTGFLASGSSALLAGGLLLVVGLFFISLSVMAFLGQGDLISRIVAL
jgi:hypothetical protein